MLSILDLPRELYLDVCSYLEPFDLSKLARVSRDHYSAVQGPLYARIRITSYQSLVKLVHTLPRVPVVSHISPQQRSRWHQLSDAQLYERDIKRLDLVIDSHGKDARRITGATVANCIGVISRQCLGVEITLTLLGAWLHFVKQLETFGLPNVIHLILFIGEDCGDMPGQHVWDLVFSGSTFCDLRSAYVNTTMISETGLPTNLEDSVGFITDDWRHTPEDRSKTSPTPTTPLYGLRKMKEIVLAHNTYLDLPVLETLFGSEIIPQNLTLLEIVDCPKLHPVKHLTALSTLLQRALLLVRHLKLHLCKLTHYDSGEFLNDWGYAARINEHPEEHLCNTVRELGKKIRSLDLAVPFACSNIFSPPIKKAKAYSQLQSFPPVPREPYGTLPDRLSAHGYKHRRLICWHAVCRDAHRWDDMIDVASEQDGDVSWEMVFPAEDRASWHVSGCLPMQYLAQDVLQKPFAASG
ncbi:hypothetical protein LTR08_002505 [Meristemomyces frigidus]|nr:hypothetical protein LTR08_002505 [Meristemomyces frigidus]